MKLEVKVKDKGRDDVLEKMPKVGQKILSELPSS